MIEEEYIKKRVGSTKNAFQVPEGYFDQFTQRMMQQLPQQRKPVAMWPRILRYAATLIVVVGCGIGFYLYQHPSETTNGQTAEVTTDQTEYDYMEEALDYAMVGNDEIAEYLTEAE